MNRRRSGILAARARVRLLSPCRYVDAAIGHGSPPGRGLNERSPVCDVEAAATTGLKEGVLRSPPPLSPSEPPPSGQGPPRRGCPALGLGDRIGCLGRKANQSGQTVRVGFPMRFLGVCGGFCGGPDHAHARLGARSDPVYAIANGRILGAGDLIPYSLDGCG
jgi:hypothetical protein